MRSKGKKKPAERTFHLRGMGDVRIVIQRDYSQGFQTQWNEEFPPELAHYGVTEDQFYYTIHRLNELFHQTEHYGITTCLEASLAFFTLYTSWLCIPSQYTRGKARIEQFLREQNENVYDPHVRWLNPFRNGLLNIIIVASSSGRGLDHERRYRKPSPPKDDEVSENNHSNEPSPDPSFISP